ncbi:VOC family protein [Ornithinimicrobium cerasi]|uniref:VOC family protein n=1 Tax=Ornithinimicrobium cerasi TaxID=2248773 RepID=UPI00192A63F4|nr:VOC family protein [Ornithinimicrobium cerasi]
MSRVVHFEIHAEDVGRAVAFYGDVFGWTFEDWSEFAGMPTRARSPGRRGRRASTGP